MESDDMGKKTTGVWHQFYSMFTDISFLLIKKDLCDSQNISIKFPHALLVYLYISSFDLFIF